MSTRILSPGETCATVIDPPRSGLLVDGRDFYRALYDACERAERTIVMAGWQFGTGVELLHGDDAHGCPHPTRFVDFLRALCDERPQLEIYLLAWDASAVFALEREPLQKLLFTVRGHRRIHYRMDNCHPVGASQHQKFVVVDRAIAFVGGMDVCESRWDAREHAAECPDRCSRGKPYAPYHDVQAYLTGDGVDVLRGWFAERWRLATGKALALPDAPRTEIRIRPTLALTADRVALARTLPEMEEPPIAAARELFALHLRAIESAERLIYLENQYFSSDEIAAALIGRMEHHGGPPLQIVLVLPAKSAGFKERISIGAYQRALLAQLTRVAAATGHHLGVYYTAAPGADGDVPVFIHSKVLCVDDRLVLVSSANTSNRSMGFDTELGIAWESDAPTDVLRRVRIDLLGEHCGLAGREAIWRLGRIPGLVARLDALASARTHRLRIHARNQDERPGWLLSKFLPDEDSPFDPDKSMVEALPEPEAWLDRVLRDPLVVVAEGARRLGRRVLRR